MYHVRQKTWHEQRFPWVQAAWKQTRYWYWSSAYKYHFSTAVRSYSYYMSYTLGYSLKINQTCNILEWSITTAKQTQIPMHMYCLPICSYAQVFPHKPIHNRYIWEWYNIKMICCYSLFICMSLSAGASAYFAATVCLCQGVCVSLLSSTATLLSFLS